MIRVSEIELLVGRFFIMLVADARSKGRASVFFVQFESCLKSFLDTIFLRSRKIFVYLSYA